MGAFGFVPDHACILSQLTVPAQKPKVIDHGTLEMDTNPQSPGYECVNDIVLEISQPAQLSLPSSLAFVISLLRQPWTRVHSLTYTLFFTYTYSDWN